MKLTEKDLRALEYATDQLKDLCECGSEADSTWEMHEAMVDLLERAKEFKKSKKRKLLFTPHQINALFEQMRDCDSMIGGGEHESDKVWLKRVKLVDKMFAANGLPTVQGEE